MGGFDKPGVAVDEPMNRRSGSRMANLGDRFARAFSTSERIAPDRNVHGDPEYPGDGPQQVPWDHLLPRFPITRQGYDCVVVDQHVAELERELNELDQKLGDLRARTPSRSETAAEIERIGEETSAILLAAHDSAQGITRLAQAQADRCIADASSNAVAITAEANRQLRELHSETMALDRERARLLDNVRGVADALAALADGAPKPELPEPVQASLPAEVESEPVAEDDVCG